MSFQSEREYIPRTQCGTQFTWRNYRCACEVSATDPNVDHPLLLIHPIGMKLGILAIFAADGFEDRSL